MYTPLDGFCYEEIERRAALFRLTAFFMREAAMARVSEEEIRALKREISLERLAEARGVKLKQHGKDLIGLCPFHDDHEPSLVITPDKNLWHCLGACQAGGTVIDWVMKAEGVSFRHAVELLRQGIPSLAAEPRERRPPERTRGAEASERGRHERRRRGALARGGGLLPPDAAGEPGSARVLGEARDPKRGGDSEIQARALRTARCPIGFRRARGTAAPSFERRSRASGSFARAGTST